ncbi:15457_t:CDS:2, partial [Racocetra persica]
MVPCYGISKDLEGNYIMVMEYMEEGNLREYLKKNRELDLKSEIDFLPQIIQGLKDIHRKHLVHRDFHSGNIIVDENKNYPYKDVCRITDLGLSKPADEKDDNQVYGIVPYVAPEVLKGEKYIQNSDIYSLGMIMYEIITGIPPFGNESHNLKLSLRICRGERPKFPDQEPNNRPTAREVSEAEEYNETLPDKIQYPTYHSQE